MRVAFTLVGGRQWTGGYNYLLNLFRVLRLRTGHGVEPVLFVGDDTPREDLSPFAEVLDEPPVVLPDFAHMAAARRLARSCLVGTLPALARAFAERRIDVVFESAQFYGWRFPIHTLAWIPDFQHRHLPRMFSPTAYWRRELGYRAQVAAGRTIMLSSEDARHDCETFYPSSRGRTVVVRFAVAAPGLERPAEASLLARYRLPPKFLYLPNQFWRHKNHTLVIDALACLKQRGLSVVIAASGNPEDVRHAGHYDELRRRVVQLGLGEEFRFVGMLPFADVLGLTSLCHALVNPSLFEGWSTTVEEAKTLGAPLVLSDLRVHREQAGAEAIYFDPASPESAAAALGQAWRRAAEAPALRVQRARASVERRTGEYARRFGDAVRLAREPRLAHRRARLSSPRRDGRNLKVLLVHNYYRSNSPGGEDNVVRQERDLLRAAGMQVVEYSRHNDEVADRDRFGLLHAASRMHWSRQTYDELRQLLGRERPDVAHFHNTFPLITPSAYAACRAAGVPVVQTLHNYRFVCAAGTFFRRGAVCEQCSAGRPWPAVRYGCYRDSRPATAAVARMLASNWRRGTYVEDIDLYLVLSRFAARKFASLGLPPERIVVKPNFVDSLAPASDGSGGYAVFAARLSEEKGVRTLLRAWRGLRDVPLKVLGDGPLLAEMSAAAHEERLPIEFTGMLSREEVVHLVGEAALQVISSECYEGFPLALVESYARGTPVIASRIGSLIELVVPGETGLHFVPGDAESLAAAVRRVWEDATLRARMRVAARRQFEAHYTPQQNLAELLLAYERVLEGGVNIETSEIAAVGS